MFGRQKKQGFTLIELLVVIAIVGLLIAVITPALNKARQAGRAIVCKSLNKNYTLALFSYFTTTRNLLPISIQDPDKNYEMQPWFTFDDFRAAVEMPYLSDHLKRWYGAEQPFKPSYEKKYICPSAKYALANPENGLYPFHRSYGQNVHIYQAGGYVKERLMSQSSRIICMADTIDWWFNYWQCDQYSIYGDTWQGVDTYGSAAYRHSGKALVSFWDGHIKEMDSTTLKANLDEWMRAEQRQSTR